MIRITLLPPDGDAFVTLEIDSLTFGIKKHFVGAADCWELGDHLARIRVHDDHSSRQPPVRLSRIHPAAYKKPMVSGIYCRGHGSLAFGRGRPGCEHSSLVKIDHRDL